jgi:hypothetical protein
LGWERSVEEKKAPDERQRGRYTLFLGLQQIIIKYDGVKISKKNYKKNLVGNKF